MIELTQSPHSASYSHNRDLLIACPFCGDASTSTWVCPNCRKLLNWTSRIPITAEISSLTNQTLLWAKSLSNSDLHFLVPHIADSLIRARMSAGIPEPKDHISSEARDTLLAVRSSRGGFVTVDTIETEEERLNVIRKMLFS